ncbi:MAG: HAAS signaling domain-containing protein [Acidimicrobiales bacterium]
MSTRTDRAVSGYLDRLEDALAPVPGARRRQLLEEIAGHIAEARRGLDPDDEVGLLAVLDAVGDPGTIAGEALAALPGTAAEPRSGPFVPWLVLLGGFVFGVGWLLGIALLWSSATWRLRDKLLATLVVPGGLLMPVLLVGMPTSTSACSASGGPGLPTVVTHCTTSGLVVALPVGIAVLVTTVLGPILVAVHLDRVRQRLMP